jgi:murein L,D-transpeptidase YcbB/YkuD
LFLVLIMTLVSCQKKRINPNSSLTLSYYNSTAVSDYSISTNHVWGEIRNMARADTDSMSADGYVRRFYLNHKLLIWSDRKGMDHRADSLVDYLQRVDSMGFSSRRFGLDKIRADLQRLRKLDFDREDNTISKVIGRLEYRLTKAYLRYAIGQRFGFVNPTRLLNRLDVQREADPQSFRRLFDLKIDRVSQQYVNRIMWKARVDSVTEVLRSAEPRSPMYQALRRQLACGKHSVADRVRLLVNMERCRWRMADYPQQHEKYVLVNIPSFHLQAVDGDSVLTMRIAFGSLDTKTPLMSGRIKRMEINPQWIMPKSIIRNSIIPRLGNHSYFASRNYFIRERSTGKRVDVRHVNRAMLESGQYLVIQRGGEGNALGRVIFRFDNNLSIYLHDTSSRGVFQQTDRDVSHGCIRVELPADLATFLFKEKDERLLEKIRYSMQADVSPLGMTREELTDHMQAVLDTLQRDKLVGRIEVTPAVPVYILYFTLYPDRQGHYVAYDDVYGYDKVIYAILRNYL